MPTESSVRFVDRLQECQILDEDQLRAISQLPQARDNDPRPMARLLLQRGWLTTYQINQIAQGRGQSLLIDRYIVLEWLGEGAMGQVFKARHRRMNRIVALKVIRREKLNNADAVRRFYQEIEAIARLNHPNIVAGYDAGQVGKTHYFAMEYVEGVDLARLVKEHGPLPVAQACEYVRQAALGLAHAHEMGLVHRDVKPHNLLISRIAGNDTSPPREVVKLMDLGLARLQGPGDNQGQLTQLGAIIGTPDYVAPEQALHARAADVRSDLYSLGGTLYFLLTGRPPFQAASLAEILLKHQTEKPLPLAALGLSVPAGVQAILDRLLAKKPDDRFQTPKEVVGALEPFCQEEKIAPDTFESLRSRPAPSSDGPDWGSLTVEEQPRPVPRRRRAPEPRRRVPRTVDRTGNRRVALMLILTGGAILLALVLGIIVLWKFPRSLSKVLTHGSSEKLPRWDVASGRELLQCYGHDQPVASVAIAPDGKQAVSSGHDRRTLLWKLSE